MCDELAVVKVNTFSSVPTTDPKFSLLRATKLLGIPLLKYTLTVSVAPGFWNVKLILL